MKGRARVGIALGILIAALAACTSPGDDEPRGDEPLATVATADLMCDFLPRSGVEQAVGERVDGRGTLIRDDEHRVETGYCAVHPHGKVGNLMGAQIDWIHSGIGREYASDLRRRLAENPEEALPIDVGIGASQEGEGRDARGNEFATAQTNLLWGDWIIGVSIRRPAPGRDPVDDSIAVAQQIADALSLPREPSKPYVTASAP